VKGDEGFVERVEFVKKWCWKYDKENERVRWWEMGASVQCKRSCEWNIPK